jgi:hypothetical protein
MREWNVANSGLSLYKNFRNEGMKSEFDLNLTFCGANSLLTII